MNELPQVCRPFGDQDKNAYASRRRKPARMLATVCILFATFNFVSVSTVMDTFLHSTFRRLCDTYYLGNNENDPYWEHSYPAVHFYPGGDRDLPSGTIGFAVSLSSCPGDTSYQAGVDTQHDPGHSLYDAAAVLKHSIEKNLEAGGKYSYTMHATIHPEAIICEDPNGDEYDRVKVLESLGYYVNIQDSPAKPEEIESLGVTNNVDSDAGNRDLIALQALKLGTHPVMVMINFDTMIMSPLDPLIDSFIADPYKKIAFGELPPAPNGVVAVDPCLIIATPDAELVDTLAKLYKNTPYDPVNGWDSSGVGNFDGALGTTGILTHYFTNIEPGVAMKLNHCHYGNDHQGECLNTLPNEVVSTCGYSTCGYPWDCPDYSGLPSAERTMCKTFAKYWYETRKDFEDNCWISGPKPKYSGSYNAAVAQGMCSKTGKEGYNNMIIDKPAPISCDPKTHTTHDTSILQYGNGKHQNQKLTLTTGQNTGQSEACVYGMFSKAGFEPPFNICMVIDVSGSSGWSFNGTPTGDVNGDGRSNTILDAEVQSMLEILQQIADSGTLGNNNINIGLVSFSTRAKYHGMYQPLDPSDTTKINGALKTKLLSLRAGGWTHFDDALDKAIDYFREAPPDRSNLLFFLSDGVPNVSGDGDNEQYVRPSRNSGNSPHTINFNSELAILDSLSVSRLAVGVGSGSEVWTGSGLDKIDNTPDEITGVGAEQVLTTDALTHVLLNNPVVGEVTTFQIEVNGVINPNFDTNTVVTGPVGFDYGTLIVGGFDPTLGAVNTVRVTATVALQSSSHTMSTENTIIGGLI